MFEPIQNGLEGMEAMMRMWSDLASRTVQASTAFQPQNSPPEAIREVRGALLKVWAEAWDQFARTPQFLDGMRRSMTASAQCNRFWLDFFNLWQQAFLGGNPPGMQQITSASERWQDQMLSAGRQWQDQMLSAVEAMNAQLQHVVHRMDRLEHRAEEKRQTVRKEPEVRRERRLRRGAGKNGRD